MRSGVLIHTSNLTSMTPIDILSVMNPTSRQRSTVRIVV
ncbi:hypothetical protein SAMN04489714_1474 [Schaalia radingae]|uniref:Uncharacterized protein n=1 Tax=Schaalia radingae TaxID=131110 RepID=A0ABY0V8Y1_9ACTO|nr:hypothetical protein SAMN04489714_1474 [Schaalia radingae]